MRISAEIENGKSTKPVGRKMARKLKLEGPKIGTGDTIPHARSKRDSDIVIPGRLEYRYTQATRRVDGGVRRVLRAAGSHY